MHFILFPTQLFELKYIDKQFHDFNFYLLEHPKFYGSEGKFNFNKKKIILHKASSLSYIDAMKDKIKIKNVDKYPIIKNAIIYIFDIIDHEIRKEIITFYEKLNTKVNILENLNFMTSKENLRIFFNNKKKLQHSVFYKYQLKLHNIPYIDKSYDYENRNAISKNINFDDVNIVVNNNKYVKKAIYFTEKYFKNNCGDCDDFYFPVNHNEAKKWFDDFLQHKMNFFAKYQDAIIPKQPFLYHSVISSMLNIGLLQPEYIIKKIIKTYNEKKISINDYEAFIRQIIGWREYQRLIYEFMYEKIINKNYFNNNNKLSKHWYNGTLNIPPVDDAIKIAFHYGYLHHIIRLMVMCNFMNLCNIQPKYVYKWFMEFSTDSYEWVMVGNVYGMGLWSDGGLTMRKPYFSSDNYINEMSNNRYKSGEWNIIWKALYYNFIMKNKKKLEKTIYIRNIKYTEKFDSEKIKFIKNTSKNFLKKIE